MSIPIRAPLRLIARSSASSSRVSIPFCRFSTSPLSAAAPTSPPPPAAPSKENPISSGPKQPSILVAGTVMTGLSVMKDQPDPVALPDNQYPSWLWTILDEPSSANDGQVDFQQQKKKLRATNKANIKAANYIKTT